MAQVLLDPGDGQHLQVAARLAEFHTTQEHFADGELPSDEVIEGHAARQQVSAALVRLQGQGAVALECFQGFALDQGDFLFGGAAALLAEVAIAHQSTAGNRFHLFDGVQVCPLASVQQDRQQLTVEHGCLVSPASRRANPESPAVVRMLALTNSPPRLRYVRVEGVYNPISLQPII
jgi:hypothetical protein